MIVPRQLQVVKPGALEGDVRRFVLGAGGSTPRSARRNAGIPGTLEATLAVTAPDDDRLEPALETPAEADGDSVS